MRRARKARTPWRFPDELDWGSYLQIDVGINSPASEGESERDALFQALLDDIGSKMGLKVLIAGAKSISAVGRRAFLKDRSLWYYATLVPSMGGEIEEIRRHTGEILDFYVRKYGSARRRSKRKRLI